MIAKLGDDLAELVAALERRGDDFAWLGLRKFGEALATLGGGALMEKVLSRSLHRHGPHVGQSVMQIWEGIDGWPQAREKVESR